MGFVKVAAQILRLTKHIVVKHPHYNAVDPRLVWNHVSIFWKNDVSRPYTEHEIAVDQWQQGSYGLRGDRFEMGAAWGNHTHPDLELNLLLSGQVQYLHCGQRYQSAHRPIGGLLGWTSPWRGGRRRAGGLLLSHRASASAAHLGSITYASHNYYGEQ